MSQNYNIITQMMYNCKTSKIGEPYKYQLLHGKTIITDLWNDELTIRLEDEEGYEIESQILSYYDMTDKDLEDTIMHILNCAEREMA